jgi:hypothetical protein
LFCRIPALVVIDADVRFGGCGEDPDAAGCSSCRKSDEADKGHYRKCHHKYVSL